MPSTEALRRYSRTSKRRLLAWVLLIAAVTVSLGLGFSAERRSVTNKRIIERRGAPCVRVDRGPQKGKPSAGCRRIARLVAEQCRATPRLCRPLVRVTVTTPVGRRLVRRELRRVLRQRAAAAQSRPDGRPTPGAPSPPSPPSPPGAPSPSPPGVGQVPSPTAPTPTPSPSPTPTPTPVPTPPGVPPPTDVVRDPVGTVGGLTCQLGVCLPPLPGAPPLP